jgi:hypothetical protein
MYKNMDSSGGIGGDADKENGFKFFDLKTSRKGYYKDDQCPVSGSH